MSHRRRQRRGDSPRGKRLGAGWLNTAIAVLALVLLAGLAFMWVSQRSANTDPETLPQTQVTPQTGVSAAPGTQGAGADEAGGGVSAEPAQTVTEVEPLPDGETGVAEGPDETDFAPATNAPPVTASGSGPDASAANTPQASSASGGSAGSAASGAQPRSGGAVPTSAARVPTRSEYRISLGSFGSSAEAVQSTTSVARIGYTVYSIDLGNQVVAQVGPFASAAAGQAALADIRRVYGGASLFAPVAQSAPSTPAPSTPAPSAPAQSAPAANTPPPASTPPASAPVPKPTPAPKPQQPAPQQAAPQPTPTPPAQAPAPTPPAQAPAQAPAEASNVYLQVGAFEDFERAQELVESLQSQGFAPSVNAPEGSMARVLIGPFSGSAIAEAEARLDANGYAHFRLR